MVSKRQGTAMWCGGTAIPAASNLSIEATPERCVESALLLPAVWLAGVACCIEAALQFSADVRLIRERTLAITGWGKVTDGEARSGRGLWPFRATRHVAIPVKK
jgi:hypothetical protein